MKIALVHPKFDRSGGAERYSLGLAAGLAETGHEVHLFGRRVEGAPDACVVHPISALPLGRALKTWSFCASAGKAVGRELFDVVQGFGKTTCQTVHRTGGGLHRAYLERTSGRSRTIYDRMVLRIEDKLFSRRELQAVICPSTWVAAEVRRFYPEVSPKIHVIPNGVDTREFLPEGRESERRNLCLRLGIPTDVPLLLFVATNFRLKGLPAAMASLADLPSARLLVAGGDDSREFLSLAKTMGIAERLHFLGEIRDMATLYPAVDVLVHPTTYDPFANVCLEALSCGTPVVTTDANGASDLLKDGQAGIVVSLADCSRALGPAVASILARSEPAREAARRLACAHSIEAHVANVLRLYQSVADGAPQ